MGAAQSSNEEKGKNNFVRTLESFEKLVVLGIVIYIIYMVFKFNNSDAAKGVTEVIGSVGAFAHYLAANPGLIIGGFIAYLVTDILIAGAGVLAGRRKNEVRDGITFTGDIFNAEGSVREALIKKGFSEEEISSQLSRGARKVLADKEKQIVKSGEVNGVPASEAQIKASKVAVNNAEKAADGDNDEEANDAENGATEYEEVMTAE